MSDKEIYVAYILSQSDIATQLLRYEFQHPIVEYWGEPEEQAKLKAYFKENHYTHEEPLIIEASEVIDYMPYVSDSPAPQAETGAETE